MAVAWMRSRWIKSARTECVPHPKPKRSPQLGVGLALGVWILGECNAGQPKVSLNVVDQNAAVSANPEELHMWMTVGERRFTITLADTDAARAFAAQFPLTLDMAELNGNEKHADLQRPLPTNAVRPGTIHAGDLMLYGSRTVVIFYETFRSPYSYTRLGRVNEPGDLGRVLGPHTSRVTFSKQ
jgi:hypothetical protein